MRAETSLKLRVYSKREFSTKDLSNVKYTTKKYKTEFVLSSVQKEALIGIILGDGFKSLRTPITR
jgi:hypothetical protein